MGYINLSIKVRGQVKPYILFSADYLNEAWLAEAFEDGTTHIVKQFKCRKFHRCFYDVYDYIESNLGEVTELTGNDVEPRYETMLRNILINRTHIPKRKIPVISINFRPTPLFTFWRQQQFSGDQLA